MKDDLELTLSDFTTMLHTGEVISKVAVLMSISRLFYKARLSYMVVCRRTNKPEWPTYTHDDRDFKCDLACRLRPSIGI